MRFLFLILAVLLLSTPTWADTPIRTTYTSPIVEFGTEEWYVGGGRLDIQATIQGKNSSLKVCIDHRDTMTVLEYTGSRKTDLQFFTVTPHVARALYKALGRTLAKLDSLEAKQKEYPR